MPRRPRYKSAPGFFHVLNRSAREITLFRRPNDYRAFLHVLGAGLARHPVRLIAYTVMPNHFHLVMGPAHPEAVARLMHWVGTTHAKRWHTQRKTVGQGPVYQGRYTAVACQEASELLRVCRDVERNALRAGLAKRAQDWPWCSLSDRLHPPQVLPLVTTPFLEHDAWVAYVNEPRTLAERLTPVAPAGAETWDKQPVPLDDVSKTPGGFVGGVEGGKDVGRGVRRDDEDQADAHVEGAEHLAVVEPPRLLQPRKQRRHRPALPVNRERAALG
jgi:putative transposase